MINSKFSTVICVLLLLSISGCDSGGNPENNNELPITDLTDDASTNGGSENDSNQSSDDASTPEESTGQSPSAVPELSGVAYTDTEAELFWERATDSDGVIVGYNIHRDESLLARTLDATSYFDDTATPGTTHTYSVIAVDNSNNFSEASEITISIPEQYDALNSENYQDIVRYIISTYSGNTVVDSMVQPFLALDSVEPDSITPVEPGSYLFIEAYTCANGGTATSTGYAGYEGASEIVFNDCQIDDDVYTGNVAYSYYNGQSRTRDYENYVATSSSGEAIRIDGNYYSANFVCGSDNNRARSFSGLNWSNESYGGATVISDATTRVDHGTLCGEAWRANMLGSITLRAPETGNKTLTIDVTTDFFTTNEESLNLESGRMAITASDDSSLVLESDSGDIRTVNITIVNTNGVQNFSEPWATWSNDFLF